MIKVIKLFKSLILFNLIFILPCAFAQESIEGEYLIKFNQDVSTFHAEALSQILGFSSTEVLNEQDILLAKENSSAGLDKKTIKDLLAAGVIEIFEPNYIIHLNSTPNDPRFTDLWGMHNTGGSGGTADVDIDAPEAWDLTTGTSSTVIGVIDTGVNYNHQDLSANMWVNSGEVPGNNIDDDNNGIIDDVYGYNAITNSGNPLDDNGHGSHCAGTIAGVGNNGVGVTGVCYNCKIMALKFLSASGSGSTSDAIKTINYAIEQKQKGVNIKVLSNSWGGSGSSSALESAISLANTNGILFVAAAGNEGKNNDTNASYPANYNIANVISVAAIDRAGNLASFSNYGASKVHLAAPGVSILSTVLSNSYSSYNGTSMATPHVAGVAGLLLSREPTLSVASLKARIVSSAKPLASLNGMVQSGGMVSAFRALGSSQTPAPPTSTINYRLKQIPIEYDSELGTKVSNADDAQFTKTLPFSFPYFGVNYPRLVISTNGRVAPLGSSGTVDISGDYNNSVGQGINVLNDDYISSPYSSSGGMWYKEDSDKVTISWVVTPYAFMNSANSVNEMTFQAVLNKSGKITFRFLDTLTTSNSYSYGASATSSISPMSDGSGDTLIISHNTANQTYIDSNKSVELNRLERALFSDYDGDGKSDLIVFRPSSAVWYVLQSSNSFNINDIGIHQLGLPGDTPIIGDFDGDHKTDLVVWRPSNGTWYFKNSSSNYNTITSIQWGMQGDFPVTGDVDGDYISDIIVYRQSSGSFYSLLSTSGFNRTAALGGSQNAFRQVQVGGLANDPVIGDFTGDGADDYVTLWQLIRFWQIKSSSGQFISSLPWGNPGDTPRACDFNNDGIDDRIVVRPNPNYLIDWFGALTGGGVNSFTFGSLGDIPGCRHDYDGDGVSEAVVFRPTSGHWFIRDGRTGNLITQEFGLPGDIPMTY